MNQTRAQVYTVLNSLVSDDVLALENIENRIIQLSEEGQSYASNGTPEAQYVNALVKDEETLKTDVEEKIGAQLAKIGFGKAMKNKWIKIGGDKKEKVTRIVEKISDKDQELLNSYIANSDEKKHDKKVVDQMKKRQLLSIITEKTFKITKGANYAPDFKKLPTTLTAEMIRTGEWKNMKFKKQNWNAQGLYPNGGHLHPLLKVRS